MLKRSRLDRFISHHARVPLKEVRRQIVQGLVLVNHLVVRNPLEQVSQFDQVFFDNGLIGYVEPVYLLLNKPPGVLSATKDEEFATVIDYVPLDLCKNPETLHYAGRLDRASTGMMLLTNDGYWSKGISDNPNVTKQYLVTLAEPLKASDIQAFAQGMYFEYEDIHTLPAKLEILDKKLARVAIVEGRYHQIKRMFHRVNNQVVSLHREQIGALKMEESLKTGQCRALTKDEVENLRNPIR